MLLMKAFFRRITKDFKHKELLPLKLLFFVHASTLFVLYPYLTIHMRELGINVEETAIMSAVTPVVAIIMPPLAGMVADHIGNFRILLALFSSLGGAASLLLLLVPVGRITITYPERLILDVGCGQTGNFELSNSGQQACHYTNALKSGHSHQVPLTLEACGFLCHPEIGGQITPLLSAPGTEEDMSKLLREAHSYDVIISGNITNTFSYSLTSEQMSAISKLYNRGDGDDDLRNHRLKSNNDLFRTSVRMLSNDSFFFPTSGLYNISCVTVNDTLSTVFQCKFGENINLDDGVSKIQVSRKQFGSNISLTSEKNKFKVTSLFNWTSVTEDYKATCEDSLSQNNHKVSISVPLGERIVQLSRCMPRCLLTTPRKELCSNLKEEKEFDIKLTFWTYLVIRVFIGMIGGTAFAMFEGAVIAILREQNADYGLQRIYATIGGMISSPLSGLLIDYASRGKGYTDFRPAFYLYAGLKIASGLLMLTINLEFKAPAKNVIADVKSVLKNVEIVALFIAIFVLGTAWGYIESFLFWLLQDLGGSRSLMGITITVGGIAGIPLLVLSGPIIDRIGHANVLFIGFVFYAIRLLGYSLIYNPWLCLIFEAMESVTSSLSFTAAVTYAAKLSTTTTDSSIQGLLGGVYFGVGKGAGSLFGGYMMKAFGTRPTYRIFSVVCTVTGIAYFLFNKFYLRKRPQTEGNDIVKKKPKPGDTVEIDLTGAKKEKHFNNLSNNIENNSKIEENNLKNIEIKNDFSTKMKIHENSTVGETNDGHSNKVNEYNENFGYDTADDGEEQSSGNNKVQNKKLNEVSEDKKITRCELEKKTKESQNEKN